MARKVCLVSLVVFGLVCFQMAETSFADAEAELELAEQYQDDRNYEQAEATYEAVAASYPDSSEAVTAQAKLTALYIVWGKQPQADAAYKRLQTKFSEHPSLAKGLYTVAKAYERRGKYKQAGDLYRDIVEQYPDSQCTDRASLHAAKVEILLLIEKGRDSEVRAAINELVSDFNDVDVSDFKDPTLIDHEELPETLYDIAKECQRAEDYNEARYLYQQILQQHAQSRYARKAQFDVEALSIFSLGDRANDVDVKTAVDGFVTKFAAHQYLPTAVYKIAVEYHMKAYRLINKGLTDRAEGCFQKASLVFERVANEFPGAGDVPKALRSAGDCYRKLGRYAESTRCYQKVVDDYPDFETAWNALFTIGRNHEDLKESGAISKSEADSKTKAVYEQLLKEFPSCPGTKHARRWLSRHNSK
jgi:TolA-binding protein